MKTTLTNVNGILCIHESDPLSDEPITLERDWPTSLRVVDFMRNYCIIKDINLEDLTVFHVVPSGSSKYRVYYKDMPGSTEVCLSEGNQTHCIDYTFCKKPYPCPKVRNGIETRYRDGRWQKYLRRLGWVNL